MCGGKYAFVREAEHGDGIMLSGVIRRLRVDLLGRVVLSISKPRWSGIAPTGGGSVYMGETKLCSPDGCVGVFALLLDDKHRWETILYPCMQVHSMH